jgi:hypothetical protein
MFRRLFLATSMALSLALPLAQTVTAQAHPAAVDYASVFEVSYRSCSHCGWRVYGRYNSRQEADQVAQTLRSQGNEARVTVR